MEPGGRSSVTFTGTGFCANVAMGDSAAKIIEVIASVNSIADSRAVPDRTAEGGCPHMKLLWPTKFLWPASPPADARFESSFSCHMDLDLIDGIVEISTGVPGSDGGLSSSLRVGGARQNRIVAAFGPPIIGPEAPRIMSLLAAKADRIPAGAAVGGDFHLHDAGFASPRGSLDSDFAGLKARAIQRAGDHRLHIQCRDRVGIFWLHGIARLHGLIVKAVTGTHEVACEF